MRVEIDSYILDTLMRDLNWHDRRPSSFMVYLYLWGKTRAKGVRSVAVSHQQLADAVGLSRRAVQNAIGVLAGRRLLGITRRNRTSIPVYEVKRPWARKRVAS